MWVKIVGAVNLVVIVTEYCVLFFSAMRQINLTQSFNGQFDRLSPFNDLADDTRI